MVMIGVIFELALLTLLCPCQHYSFPAYAVINFAMHRDVGFKISDTAKYILKTVKKRLMPDMCHAKYAEHNLIVPKPTIIIGIRRNHDR